MTLPSSFISPRILALVLPLLAVVGLNTAAAQTTIAFSDETTFGEVFTSTSTTSGSTVSLTGNGQVDLLATSASTSAAARVTIYSSAALSSDFDFISGSLTLTFTNITLNYSSAGSGNNGKFGISSTSAGALGSSGNAIYFQINRVDQTLSLIESIGGVTTTLFTWSNSQLNSAYDNITSLTLTLTDSTWSVSGTAVRKSNSSQTATISGSGSLGVVWTSESWGSDTLLALEANQTAKGDTSRYSELLMGTITATTSAAIPEPRTAALGAGAACLLLACWRRLRRGLS